MPGSLYRAMNLPTTVVWYIVLDGLGFASQCGEYTTALYSFQLVVPKQSNQSFKTKGLTLPVFAAIFMYNANLPTLLNVTSMSMKKGRDV
eukprot:8598710-Ditylum_brightwellii.AAC.1